METTHETEKAERKGGLVGIFSKAPVETYSYKGWLNSDLIWKRALAVVGYSLVGQLVITVVLCVPLILLGLTLALFTR